MKSKSIWRKYNAVKGLEVSIKGGVRRTYDDVRAWTGKGLPQMMSRQVDANGNLYVEIKKPRRMDLRIDRLVASCYYHTVGKRLQGQVFIIHKDREKTHCWAENLKWATPYEHGEFYANEEWVNTPDGYRLVLDDIYVSKEGKVKMNGEELTICDSLYDSDIDMQVAVSPHIAIWNGKYYDRSNKLDKLVAAAFLPIPDNLKSPGLIHVDMNYMNCNLNNLTWVECDSEEYQEYMDRQKADMEKRTSELNPERAKHLQIGQGV